MNSWFSLHSAASCGHHILFVATHLEKKKIPGLRSVIILGDPDVFPLQSSLALTFPPLLFTDEGKNLESAANRELSGISLSFRKN